ncbi:MAG: MBL fold metallo-hydrolase [Dehalococcoidia bacterium]|nr:MAG: MBL fold metallo-hydrolase [Dehalococcoidia bacterium]
MKTILKTVIVGQIDTNCYILGCEKSPQAIIIDPGGDYQKINRCLDENGLQAKLIINTHGHIDHIGANDKFGVPVCIHRLDADCLLEPARNFSEILLGFSSTFHPAARLLEEGDKINVGEISLEVIHTPGHSPGGICLKTDNLIFTGDTLFCAGVGRTDLPGASGEVLIKSIKEKILGLDNDVVVYPGHGASSTIGKERRENPFLSEDITYGAKRT